MPRVEISRLDEERFGVRTGKVVADSPDGVTAILDQVRALGVRLLIVRCPADQLSTAQALEAAGGRIMDVLVVYARDLRTQPIPDAASAVTIRSARPEDADRVASLAGQSFHGYAGHYHADPRIDGALADEVYVSWARRSCLSRDVASEVLIAHNGDELLGFLTLRRSSDEEGEGVLNAVAPAAQRRGIYRALMIHAMQWCVRQGTSRMVISTQITSVAVQRVWTRLGFELQKSYLTFHAWFPQDAE